MTKQQIANYIVKKAQECFEYGNDISLLDVKKEQQAQIFAYWEMYLNCFANGNVFDETCEIFKNMYMTLGEQISNGYAEIFK